MGIPKRPGLPFVPVKEVSLYFVIIAKEKPLPKHEHFLMSLVLNSRMRLMTIIVEATVTAKTGTKLSHEAHNVSPERKETARTSAQELTLFFRVSSKHLIPFWSSIFRLGLAFKAELNFSTKSHWHVQ